MTMQNEMTVLSSHDLTTSQSHACILCKHERAYCQNNAPTKPMELSSITTCTRYSCSRLFVLLLFCVRRILCKIEPLGMPPRTLTWSLHTQTCRYPTHCWHLPHITEIPYWTFVDLSDGLTLAAPVWLLRIYNCQSFATSWWTWRIALAPLIDYHSLQPLWHTCCVFARLIYINKSRKHLSLALHREYWWESLQQRGFLGSTKLHCVRVSWNTHR